MECVELCNFHFCCVFILHSFCVHFLSANNKKTNFLVHPELLVNDILRRVALGTRMDLAELKTGDNYTSGTLA